MTKNAANVLKTSFGFETFRPLQEEIIQRVLNGGDTVVLMPTGGGKSLCFQVPAMIIDGMTLVISPLISLMKDQVQALRANGVSAAYFNSSQSASERNNLIQNLLHGNIKILYMAPETVLNSITEWLGGLPIALIAVDEAHCVSMWGHDFRTEYTQLNVLRQKWPDATWMALTATADKAVRKEIMTKLGLQKPKVFLSSFNRPNLSLEVRGNLPKKSKWNEISNFIARNKDESGIIYCLSRKETEELSDYLRAIGIQSSHYHAGLAPEERNGVQEAFINDEVQVIVATVAFGMGIDKSNVRWVIHNNLPKNLEGYYQEIGRAGRDGLPAKTLLYYNMRDVKLMADFARESPNEKVLIEKLNRILQYAESKTCRRKTLLSYFGENLEKNCGNCDICFHPPAFFDGTILAQKALSAVKRTNEKIGVNLLIQILRGSKNSEIQYYKYDLLKTHGAGNDLSYAAWKEYINQLINLGVLEIAYDENFILKITAFGEKILYGKLKLDLATFQEESLKIIDKKNEKELKVENNNSNEHFELLRQLRNQIAKQERMPAYIVFNDASLREMANKLPSTESDFKAISGVGNQKWTNYGKVFLSLIQSIKQQAKPIEQKDNGPSIEITFDLYQSGKSAEEIAKARGLKKTTILAHLLQLYDNGKKVDLQSLISNEAFEKIKQIQDLLPKESTLKAIYEALNAEVSYDEIRIAISLLQKK